MTASVSTSMMQSVIARIGEHNIFAVIWVSYLMFLKLMYAPLFGFLLLLVLRRYLYSGSFSSHYIYAVRTFWLGLFMLGPLIFYTGYLMTQPIEFSRDPAEIIRDSMRPDYKVHLILWMTIIGMIPWYYRSFRGFMNSLRGNGIYPEPRRLILGII